MHVNAPPDCTEAYADPAVLWPPNHKMVEVHITGVTDPDGDPVTITVTGVAQDEPTNGLGDGDTSNDISGASLGTDDRSVQVRAERSGTGTGRVYTFVYRVTDSSGNFTDATATVAVPHDMGH